MVRSVPALRTYNPSYLALIPGTRLGPYEIVAAIGAGGMGEVYRATDCNLKRQVAIKVLLQTVAADPDRLARFQREAEVLAAVNHPNIAHIHGLEKSDGMLALVMELVEGLTLADRIAHGAIAIDEALPIAKQLAEALEAAHERGIIHRDLKPANIKVRADAMVKVLDFGLAKALDVGSDGSGTLSMSPTQSLHATQAGLILGTAAYMSPEQAAGNEVDKRTDVWAFGVVVMEMLTGRPVFTGENVSQVLASVLKSDPDWTALPTTTPAAVRRLLRRCLEKDRKQRLSDAADARLEIEEAMAAPREDVAPSPVPAWRRALPWTVAATFGVALVSALVLSPPWRAAPVPTPRKLLAFIGAEASMPIELGASAILSPDGTVLAFAAQQAGQTRLFVRNLDQLQASALSGTEGAGSPFFSPDGQWIAFFAGGKLKKVPVAGGASIILCDAPNSRGGTWADDGTIIFTPVNGANVTLMRVSAAGGSPAVFGTLSAGATTQRWPQALPGGKGVLYSEHSAMNGWDSGNLVVAPLAGGTGKIVVRGGHYGRYVPSGHLIYMQQGKLFAVRFDLDRLETVGQAAPAFDGISANGAISGGAQLAMSSDGTLVYVPDEYAKQINPIDWMTRDGKTSALRTTKAEWVSARFSPDGQKLALQIFDGHQSDIWVYDWNRDALTQLTFDAAEDSDPAWTPDSRRIVFDSDRARIGIPNLYSVNADGTGDVARLTDSSEPHLLPGWHPTGKFLAFTAVRRGTVDDLMILPIEGDLAREWTPGKPTVFLGTPAGEANPVFSPDGRWIAYVSNEAGGGSDVYVRPFPGPGGKWRVSTEGGTVPRWSTSGHELLFLSPQGKIMFASYTVVGDSFMADKPQIWSPTSIAGARTGRAAYDLHPDGKRVAAAATQEQTNTVQDKVVFVFNFADYLRKINTCSASSAAC